jgi:hypothetical protein
MNEKGSLTVGDPRPSAAGNVRSQWQHWLAQLTNATDARMPRTAEAASAAALAWRAARQGGCGLRFVTASPQQALR